MVQERKGRAPIFLIGFSGVGKTTIARHIERLTGLRAIDTDAYIEGRYHTTVSEIFATCGVDKFRKRERVILIELSQTCDTVIATGGGMPCSEDNISIMKERGVVVYLRSGVESLTERLEICKATRPLVAHLDRDGIGRYVAETLPRREVYYNQAHHIVDLTGMITPQDEEKVAEEIISRLGLTGTKSV